MGGGPGDTFTPRPVPSSNSHPSAAEGVAGPIGVKINAAPIFRLFPLQLNCKVNG